MKLLLKKGGYTITQEGTVHNCRGKSVGTHGKNGYMYFSFRIEGKIVKVYFHRYQAYTKFGDRLYEDGLVVRHLDGNFLNNSSSNIELGTTSDNRKERYEAKKIIKEECEDYV